MMWKLKTDRVAIEKERLDFARVLLATSSLDIINVVDNIVVDGILTEVKIIEEWGFNLGEDACLFDEENASVSAHSEHDGGLRGEDIRIQLMCL